MTEPTWLPRTPLERLIAIDTVLADIVPKITAARQRIIDILPGHSGRPAGTGDPGGGRGATTTTIVERTAFTDSDEWTALTRIDNLINNIDDLTWAIYNRHLGHHPTPLPGTSPARRLTLARWRIRQLTRTHHTPNNRTTNQLWNNVTELEAIINTWAAPRHGGQRTIDLAADPTDTWCRSCLRAGYRNHRDERHTKAGLCRWCGTFLAEQGQLPTLDILDAHESGSPIRIAQLIRDGKTANRRRKKR